MVLEKGKNSLKDIKSTSHQKKKKLINVNYIKIMNVCSLKIWESKPQSQRFAIYIYPTKDLYPEYILKLL